MRKHNKKFAQRWSREKGDTSNFPQKMAHSFTNDRFAQFWANGLLQACMVSAGILKPQF